MQTPALKSPPAGSGSNGTQPVPQTQEDHKRQTDSQRWNALDLRDSRKRKGNGSRQPLLLILGGGSDTDPKSLGHRLAHTPAEARNEYNWAVSPCAGINYDPANGEHLNIADDAVMDTLRYNVAAGDYAAAIAVQDQSTFAPQEQPSGPHPYRSAEVPPDTD